MKIQIINLKYFYLNISELAFKQKTPAFANIKLNKISLRLPQYNL